nr:endogenous retrovirus group PABLB member 1 Env polyprotein-like [Syngnathus scovelli]XP_049617758.1 endogenous retrovirus group PABLB member 1 Env polyprotein-like [Syngnathus scovelli]XP_049617759.1 endogenous retrovirus group PABLB member 1 Env polyprotein-like [Syngnathus scovelli]
MLVKNSSIPTPLGEGMSQCLCHPSSNGAPYARWILCCVVVGACYGLLTHLNRPNDNVARGKRWSHDENFEDWSWDPTNPYETNMATPSNGTYFIQNGWWLCGHKVYPMLPANWTGVCAPVWVTDHTYRIRHHLLTGARNSTGRRRRAVTTFDPHDPVWGVNVPEDHKVWSAGDKVVLALFPQIGVGKLSLVIETLNYRFQSFVNLSLQVNDGQNREIQAIRLMVLQNRMVLDLLTAAQGGVCHIIGTSCCTYIPGENDTHINDAMNSLKNLQQAMSNDKVPHQFDFFSWFFSGNWWQLLLKLLSPVLVVLVVLCSFTTCVIPCLKSAVSKFVSSTVAQVHIQLLRDDGCDDDNDTWIA